MILSSQRYFLAHSLHCQTRQFRLLTASFHHGGKVGLTTTASAPSCSSNKQQRQLLPCQQPCLPLKRPMFPKFCFLFLQPFVSLLPPSTSAFNHIVTLPQLIILKPSSLKLTLHPPIQLSVHRLTECIIDSCYHASSHGYQHRHRFLSSSLGNDSCCTSINDSRLSARTIRLSSLSPSLPDLRPRERNLYRCLPAAPTLLDVLQSSIRAGR